MSVAATAPAGRSPLAELAVLYLKLGTLAFGGPAAHIAMMEDEVVRRRRWLSHGEFPDLMAASNLIPGPSSTELAIHIGYRWVGWQGLLVGGCCFILPAALIVTAIAWAYQRFGRMPQVQGVLYGVKPVVIAIVLQALWRLGRTVVTSRLLALVGGAATAARLLGISPLIVLFGSGVVVLLIRYVGDTIATGVRLPVLAFALPSAVPAASASTAVASAVGLWPLFLVFVKLGSIVFGSGYVLLAFLRADLVVRLHWLTESQLIDAVAVGQVTPGPVFTTATFVGYLVAGPRGAAVATLGIFLPAFALVAITAPFVGRLRQSPAIGRFLDGLNVASLALMVAVTWQLGRAAIVDTLTASVAILAAIVLFRLRLNATWLVLGGAAIGACFARYGS